MNGSLSDQDRVILSKYCKDVVSIQDIVSRYVGQLVYGCGDSTCTQTACATGRRNVSTKPVRDYMVRSARAIAITLASGPSPRARLCPMYHYKPKSPPKITADGPGDPSAFVQQLVDTSSVQRLNKPGLDGGQNEVTSLSTNFLDKSPFYSCLNRWHLLFDDFSTSFKRIGPEMTLDRILNANIAIAGSLSVCLLWLAGTLPKDHHKDWHHANRFIQRGNSYPDYFSRDNHDEKSRLIYLLDSLEHGPSFRLFCRVIKIVTEYSVLELAALIDRRRHGRADWAVYSNKSLDCRLAKVIAGELFRSARPPVTIWLKMAFLRHWNGEPSLDKGSIAASALRLLDQTALHFFGPNLEGDDGKELWSHFPAIPSRVDAAELAQTYMESSLQAHEYHLLSFPSIFTQNELATYFRTLNHLRMRKAHSDAEITSHIRMRNEHLDFDVEPGDRLKWIEEHYLLLNVSRQNVVQDTFDQLWQRRRGELLRPLRIRLGETDEFEIGHDLGGVQIEFFNLLWRELLKEDAQLFTTDASTGISFFRPGSLQPLYMFELCGLLFALAIYNGITLPVNFPLAFYARFSRLIEHDPTISDMWPDIHRSLNTMISEDIPGLDAVFPFEANGLRLSVLATAVPYRYSCNSRIPLSVIEASRVVHRAPHSEPNNDAQTGSSDEAPNTSDVDIESLEYAWPGWRILRSQAPAPELTPETTPSYALAYRRWLAWGAVGPQLSAFERGFWRIIDPQSAGMLPKKTLRAIVEGTAHLDITALMQATIYENYEPESRYIRNFWRLVHGWPEEKRRRLLKFVTAIERVPVGFGRDFTFKIERPRPDGPERLPTSSTCFRTLFLPKYASVGVLEQKLTLAFEYGLEGFGSG